MARQHAVEKEIPQLVKPNSPAVEEQELFANVIEFPRSAAMPAYQTNELAEPVFDRPRIVEAPEILPPPPALGGIMLEHAASGEPERKTAADLVFPAASLPRRIWAAFLDTMILVSAIAGFGAIFVWINPDRPPVAVVATAVVTVALLSWAAYDFLFLVYTGSTPGLRLARLQLLRFDGSPTHRGLRRWRVLASYLSAMSLGLGYVWSMLDEDGLCWHDRMTRTYLS